MSLSAFHSNAKIRETALESVTAHIEAKNIQAGALEWSGDTGSFSGCLAEAGDADEWQSKLGLPSWLAYVMDAIARNVGPRKTLQLFEPLLREIPLGSDLSGAGSVIVRKLLLDAQAIRSAEGDLEDVLSTVYELHGRSAKGEDVPGGEWRAARRKAVEASDAVAPPIADGQRRPHELQLLRSLGLAVESACWDPRRSHTAVAEVMSRWIDLYRDVAENEYGWTKEDHDRVGVLLQEMHDTYIVPNKDEKRDVFQLLAEHHPAVDERLRGHIQYSKNQAEICAEKASKVVRDELMARA